MKTNRRIALFISALFVGLVLTSTTAGVHGAGRQGIFLTRNGFRAPIYGVSQVRDANGDWITECGRLTSEQVEAARFGRNVSRSMLVNSPHAVIGNTTNGATFDITYSDPQGTGFNDPATGETARKALEASVLAWTKVIQGTVTIKVDASMPMQDDSAGDSGSTLLASAGPVDFWPRDNKAVPSALMWQLTNKRQNNGDPDIQVNVNPKVDWDYAVNGAAARGKVSFVYTMIHEIGHGLGFVDSFDPETGTTLNTMPFVYDTFVNRGSGSRNVVTDHTPDATKADLISGDLFFNGTNAVDASRRSIKPLPMIKLYSPNPYEQGSSISHVDQDTYADFKTGLMTPRDFGSGTDKIDILTLGIMKDLGYQLIPNATTARVQ